MKGFDPTDEQIAAHQARVRANRGRAGAGREASVQPHSAPVRAKRLKDYKAEFLSQLALAGLPAPSAEVRFHPTRKWRWDFAFKDRMLAVEYQGGVYDKGKAGHSTTGGMERDCLKYSHGAALGWRLVLINAGMVRRGEALKLVEEALKV